MELVEQVGEPSRAMRECWKAEAGGLAKGTVDEEHWDMIYHALPNCQSVGD